MPGREGESIVARARRFSRWIHRHDIRLLSGRPFSIHPDGVGDRLEELGYDEVYVAGGICHDCVEDHRDDPYYKWSFDRLEFWLAHPKAPHVIALVRPITYPPGIDRRSIRRNWYFAALLDNPQSLPIALADKENNLADIVAHYEAGVDAFKILRQNPMDEVGYYGAFIRLGKNRLHLDPKLEPLVDALEKNLGFLCDHIRRARGITY